MYSSDSDFHLSRYWDKVVGPFLKRGFCMNENVHLFVLPSTSFWCIVTSDGQYLWEDLILYDHVDGGHNNGYYSSEQAAQKILDRYNHSNISK